MSGASELDPRIVAGTDYGNPDPAWPGIDWEARRRRVDLAGATVEYVEHGEGDPVLFVHGLSGCWQNWLENLPHFGGRRRAIAIDLPGFGASPMPAWPPTMPAYGRLVDEFCDRLGLGRVTLVGNSMGGLVAVEATIGHPERVERLALVSAAGIINTWNPEAQAAFTALAWKRIGPRLADRGRSIVRRRRSRQLFWGPIVQYPARLRTDLLLAQMDGGMRCPAFADALRSLVSRDIRGRLAEIQVPTLIVWGLADRVVPVAAALSYHRRIPGSQLEIFERTGHVPQLERPLRFNRLLDEFLAQGGGAVSR